MESLSIWADYMLQKVVHLCPAYLVDSWHFLNEICNLNELQNCRLLTVNAKAMYLNINTDHAIESIAKWFLFHKNNIPPNFPVQLLLDSIERIMRYNRFTFGNRFFLQLNGTLMGTNVGCMYATIYYSIHKEQIILPHRAVCFYRRLINDAFVIISNDDTSYQTVYNLMNSFGPESKRLEWETENKGSMEVNFLDLTVSIRDDGTIATKTYQKPMNLYLYRCPSSAQPPSILYRLIYGTIHRYFWQNTDTEDFDLFTAKFFQRLLNQAHLRLTLEPLFDKALLRVQTSKLPNPLPGSEQDSPNKGQVFVHSPYHPQYPPQEMINVPKQELFKLISEFEPNLFDRIIVAFSCAPNIGDLCKKNQLEADVDTSEVGL